MTFLHTKKETLPSVLYIAQVFVIDILPYFSPGIPEINCKKWGLVFAYLYSIGDPFPTAVVRKGSLQFVISFFYPVSGVALH